MTVSRVFVTGCSGFIGGDFLHALSQEQLPISLTVLERSQADADVISAAYPHARIVQGNLDDSEMLQRESCKAEIVVNLASAQHFGSLQAIHQGLSQGVADTKHARYLIQISGATLLSSNEVIAQRFGETSEVVINDWDQVDELRSIIRASPKRAIDNFVLDAAAQSEEGRIRTALLGGPIIYGQGRGPVNQRSGQLPEMSRIALQRGKAAYIGKGLNRWSAVHVHDFSDLIVRLVSKAVHGDGADQIWGENGIYLPGTHEAPTFGELARRIQHIAASQNITNGEGADSIPVEEANKLSPNAQLTLGTNGRGLSRRAQQVLGWRPSNSNVIQDLERTVQAEARRLDSLRC